VGGHTCNRAVGMGKTHESLGESEKAVEILAGSSCSRTQRTGPQLAPAARLFTIC